MQNNSPQTKREEVYNAISHLAFGGLFLFLLASETRPKIQGYLTIFSCMFISSFLYHIKTNHKQIFRSIDQFFIYMTIGVTGISACSSIESLQVLFIVSALIVSCVYHFVRQSLDIQEGYTIPILYLLNGLAVGTMILLDRSGADYLLFLSLSFYVVGFFFYINDHKRYFHFGWHVMSGTAAILMYAYIASSLS